MAVRAHKKARKILMPATVHPIYRKVVHAIVKNQNIELVEIPLCMECGNIPPASLKQYEGGEFAALVIPQPNFFGVLEETDALTDWAHAHNMFAIALVNPTALALLTPPGEWGTKGADIAVGEGQPLGAPLSSGGPYYGFMCCKEALVRQMPGRIIGRTVDKDGKPGFTLTLQAREQHIRRSKATSNICTNQGLVVAASTIYMALLGPEGLARVARACHANTMALFTRDMNLNPDQQKQIQAILSDTRAHYAELHDKLDPEYERVRQAGRERIRQVLTVEQKPKFEDLLRQMDEERRRRQAELAR